MHVAIHRHGNSSWCKCIERVNKHQTKFNQLDIDLYDDKVNMGRRTISK